MLLFDTPILPSATEGWGGLLYTIFTLIVSALTIWLAKRKTTAEKAEAVALDTSRPGEPFAEISDIHVRQALLALKQTHDPLEKYFPLIDLMQVAFWESDANGQCIYASDELAEVIGVDKAAILANGWITSIKDTDRNRVVDEWFSAVKEKRDFYAEYSFVHRRARQRIEVPVIGRAKKVENSSGVVRYIGVLTKTLTEK